MNRGAKPPPSSARSNANGRGSPGSGARSTSSDAALQTILRDPQFRELVQRRSAFAWTLSALMLVVYLGFILLVAFMPDVMASKVGGGTTSLGILIGLAVIVFAFALTGVYVARANGRFDEITRELKGRLK